MKKTKTKSDAIEGVVRDIARGGDGVIETERGLVFASFALPGERVRVEGLTKDGKILRGKVAAVLSPSADRVDPACPIVTRCGGCPLMPLRIDAQRALKQRFVSEAAGMPAELVPGDDPFAHRRRARLGWEKRFGATRIGYRQRRSRELVDVAKCVVLAPPLARALDLVRDELAPHLAAVGDVYLALGEGERATIGLRSDAPQSAELFTAMRALAERPDVAGLALRAGGATADALFGDPREVHVAFDGVSSQSAPFGFSQAQDEVNRELVNRVAQLAEPDGKVLLELYAGHGNLTVSLARGASRVIAVEQDARAIVALRANLAARSITNVHVIEGDAAVHAGGNRVDTVVLDPPRVGAKDAIEGIASRKPRSIVYVSCDTSTLARDLASLRERGYAVDAAYAFDMFPQTAHVEAVVRLRLS